MRVLILCEFDSLNGGERSLLEAIRHLPSTSCQIVVAAPPHGPLALELRHLRLSHYPLSMWNVNGERLPRSELRAQLAACVAATQPDLVHANSLSMSRLSGPVLQELGIPSVGHLRDIMRVSKASIADLNSHSLLVAVSQATRRWYVDMGLSDRKAVVAYNGVDLQQFRPRPGLVALHRSLGIPHTTRLVISIGQFGMRKGVDLFVSAAAEVAEKHCDVHFAFVGQRYSQKEEAVSFERKVRRLAEQACLRDRFFFLGVRSDVDRILSAATLYVHAARQEPLGRVLLEAGASGCPIVATDVGGTREIFPDDAQAAILVPPDNAAELARAISHSLSNPAQSNELGRRARMRIQHAFNGQSAARELLEWYEAVL